MRLRIPGAIILSLCLMSSAVSASVYGSYRLRPRFFAGKLDVSPVPLVGRQATVSLELTAMAGDCKDATVQLKTPAGMALLGQGVFSHQRLTKDISRRYTADIVVLEEGSYALQATVYFQLSDGERRAEHFFTYLLAGRTRSEITDDVHFLTPRQELQPKALAPSGFIQSPVGGRLSVSGYITYYDDNLSQAFFLVGAIGSGQHTDLASAAIRPPIISLVIITLGCVACMQL